MRQVPGEGRVVRRTTIIGALTVMAVVALTLGWASSSATHMLSTVKPANAEKAHWELKQGDGDGDDDDDDDDNPSKKENLADELSSDNTVDDEKNGMVNFHSRVNSLHGKPKELFMLARKCVFNLCAAELDACRKVPVCSDQLMNCIGECVSGRLIECLGDCMSGGSMFSEVTDCYDSKCRALVHGRTKKAGSTVNTELDSDS
mmetsp:Transcript_17591/g.41724  ORF Transcript_17591/g.41724 Transcript_17591/m.41724 type:complete len:203 (+) Transcript_17591:65-673(+)